MRCFNHSDSRAVGLCKWCLKGLCPECLTNIGEGLACKATCESQVLALNEHNMLAIQHGKSDLKAHPAILWMLVAFGFLSSVISFCAGVAEGWQFFDQLGILLGLIIVFWGVKGLKKRGIIR